MFRQATNFQIMSIQYRFTSEIKDAENDLLSTIQDLNNTIAKNERKLSGLKELVNGKCGDVGI